MLLYMFKDQTLIIHQIVVRDLWALRLQDFESRITDATGDDDDDTESELFSSQPAGKDESRDGFKPNSRYLEWPRLIDSVALCYLAAFLMRLPVCVIDFHEYVYCFLYASPLVCF